MASSDPKSVPGEAIGGLEDGLNPAQVDAVTHPAGPLLVVAGAGSGKTRVLTRRIAHLVVQRGVSPFAILAITFTNKAAGEMKERVAALIGPVAHDMWVSTFHSACVRILRRDAGLLGYPSRFSIYDQGDAVRLTGYVVRDLGLDVKRYPARAVHSAISAAKNEGRSASDYVEHATGPYERRLGEVFTEYQARLLKAGAMDFDDLLGNAVRLLRSQPEVLERYRGRFQHILVDEYQDTNIVQGEIVEALAQANGGNLMVVGDDCQSIYAFRGAHYDNILQFPDRNPGTEIFKLEVNYRSTPEIMALTNASISCNTGQYRKELEAHRDSGMLPALVPCNYPEQEADFVIERILQLRDEGTPLGEIAILYRAHSHRLTVETSLLRADIPYEVRGGLRFFEQAHVKDVTAHLRVALNPRDEVAFRRAVLLQQGIGNVTASRLWDALGAASEPEQFLRALAGAELASTLPPRARQGWRSFVGVLCSVVECFEAPEAAIQAIMEGGYEDLARSVFTNFESRIEDLEQLAIFAAQYDTLAAFLEELVLLGEMYGQDVKGGGGDDEERPVVMSTVHQAKGLEWDAVFFVHLVEGALPSPRALGERDGEEEERRIFYVGTTRARNELYLSYPIVRPGGGLTGALLQQPSRFLQEIPTRLMEPWEVFEAPPSQERTSLSSRGEFADSSDEWDPNVDPVWDEDSYFDTS